MEEKRMANYEQIELLKSLGQIKDIIQNEVILKRIISSGYDRHILGVLLDEVNKGIKNGEILKENLTLLRSGIIVDCILDINKTRELFPFEIGDKLNYISAIEDVEVLTSSYTNPRLIEFMNSSKNRELYYWIESGTFKYLPLETKINVANKFIETGNIENGSSLLNSTVNDMKREKEIELSAKESGRTL